MRRDGDEDKGQEDKQKLWFSKKKKYISDKNQSERGLGKTYSPQESTPEILSSLPSGQECIVNIFSFSPMLSFWSNSRTLKFGVNAS